MRGKSIRRVSACYRTLLKNNFAHKLYRGEHALSMMANSFWIDLILVLASP